MSRDILSDLARLPPERRAALEAALDEMQRAAFLQGYLAAHLWLALWCWRYGGRG